VPSGTRSRGGRPCWTHVTRVTWAAGGSQRRCRTGGTTGAEVPHSAQPRWQRRARRRAIQAGGTHHARGGGVGVGGVVEGARGARVGRCDRATSWAKVPGGAGEVGHIGGVAAAIKSGGALQAGRGGAGVVLVRARQAPDGRLASRRAVRARWAWRTAKLGAVHVHRDAAGGCGRGNVALAVVAGGAQPRRRCLPATRTVAAGGAGQAIIPRVLCAQCVHRARRTQQGCHSARRADGTRGTRAGGRAEGVAALRVGVAAGAEVPTRTQPRRRGAARNGAKLPRGAVGALHQGRETRGGVEPPSGALQHHRGGAQWAVATRGAGSGVHQSRCIAHKPSGARQTDRLRRHVLIRASGAWHGSRVTRAPMPSRARPTG